MRKDYEEKLNSIKSEFSSKVALIVKKFNSLNKKNKTILSSTVISVLLIFGFICFGSSGTEDENTSASIKNNTKIFEKDAYTKMLLNTEATSGYTWNEVIDGYKYCENKSYKHTKYNIEKKTVDVVEMKCRLTSSFVPTAENLVVKTWRGYDEIYKALVDLNNSKVIDLETIVNYKQEALNKFNNSNFNKSWLHTYFYENPVYQGRVMMKYKICKGEKASFFNFDSEGIKNFSLRTQAYANNGSLAKQLVSDYDFITNNNREPDDLKKELRSWANQYAGRIVVGAIFSDKYLNKPLYHNRSSKDDYTKHPEYDRGDNPFVITSVEYLDEAPFVIFHYDEILNGKIIKKDLKATIREIFGDIDYHIDNIDYHFEGERAYRIRTDKFYILFDNLGKVYEPVF